MSFYPRFNDDRLLTPKSSRRRSSFISEPDDYNATENHHYRRGISTPNGGSGQVRPQLVGHSQSLDPSVTQMTPRGRESDDWFARMEAKANAMLDEMRSSARQKERRRRSTSLMRESSVDESSSSGHYSGGHRSLKAQNRLSSGYYDEFSEANDEEVKGQANGHHSQSNGHSKSNGRPPPATSNGGHDLSSPQALTAAMKLLTQRQVHES
jgi:hypothetical protein